jgi:DNA-directed RNA polymerase II subunit RPB2
MEEKKTSAEQQRQEPLEELIPMNIIDRYFQDNPQALVRHHVDSYNDFFENGIFQIFKEKNPIQLRTRYDPEIDQYRSVCNLYLGGKDGSKIYFGKPIIYDSKENMHYMFPNEARIRNMTYGMTVHYDIEVEVIDILEKGEMPREIGGGDVDVEDGEDGENDEDVLTMEAVGGAPAAAANKRGRKKAITPVESVLIKELTEKSMITPNTQKQEFVLEKMFLGKFPIMLQSNYCILTGFSRDVRHTMGECRNDIGGYFIIDGKEKTVVCQEKFADNMLYIRKSGDDAYLYSAEIRSVSENVAKPIRTLSVKIVAPTSKFTFKNIVVKIPNVRQAVPLFIVFRALGFLTDKEIITMCLLDLEKYENMVDLFAPSVHDAGGVMNQQTALKYIASFTKGKTVAHSLEILADYFLPHVGEMNFIQKGYYLGYMVFRMLSVYSGMEPPTDRDNLKYKRVEQVGSLMYDLFREYYTMQQRQIHLGFEEQIVYNPGIYERNLKGLIETNYRTVFAERVVEAGFRKAFKGNWGAQTHTKRIGVVQDLNRLSHNSMISHLRKTNLPLDASVKLVGPRVLHSTQWGLFDPIDTPDGANIGIHKHLAISTYITKSISREPIIKWLIEKAEMKAVEDCSPMLLSRMTKVFVNGFWAGALYDPVAAVENVKLFRRNGLLPIYTSCTFEISRNTIWIYTDGGRCCRPIFYRDQQTRKMSFEMSKEVLEKLEKGDFEWNELISGFNEKRKETQFRPNAYKMYELGELYQGVEKQRNPAKLERFREKKAVLDYIDTNETENALIAMNPSLLKDKHTHLEIHESLLFGVMCNLIVFPENNPATRNSFSCGQSKQACSLYHTNHQVRMDKTAVVLVSGQIPIVKTRYMDYVNHEENVYGENAIVAIMCYTGYNVEDAILVNEGALKRGLFRTTYYTTYETHEEKSKVSGSDAETEKVFTNIESDMNVVGTKPGYDYSQLDKYGLIRENTPVNDKTVLIGLTSRMGDRKVDESKTPKKGQLGVVDKSFITEGEEGFRIAKIRIREERVPNLGDKMASRVGQKGTIGLIIPERDMPFTKDGIRPDLIINPHAIPSRMTIGQLVECIVGKSAVSYGGYADCTAFHNKGSKIKVFGETLVKAGYHSSGNEILYNGMTGEQIETEIFIGPTYYMRLKHMVKDKINYRTQGPRTALTRQPVSGRANDGGLRIGEMERDSVIAHGATDFLRESMMERGDKYQMAICNMTGLLAIYNPAKNLFMSPMADGPIRFTGSLVGSEGEDESLNVVNVTKFGRNFSIVNVPYSLKLFLQELQTMNIQMRLLTEDNIDQMENMTFSKNMEAITGMKTPEEIIKQIRENLNISSEKTKKTETAPKTFLQNMGFVVEEEGQGQGEEQQIQPVETTTEPSPEYAAFSPAYASPGSPEYAPGSPAYAPPESEENSPAYSPPEFYKVGDIVLYRGDEVIPPRTWKIKNIGDQFITIVPSDETGESNSKEKMKIVTREDLYIPPTPPPAEEGGLFQLPSFFTGGNGEQQMMYPSSAYPLSSPAIQFSPNIKIITNGNDLSTETQHPQQPSSLNGMGGVTIDPMMDATVGMTPMIHSFENNGPSSVMAAAAAAADTKKSDGPIDFSKLLIVKKDGGGSTGN